uniref:ORF; putative n=1 Tax=Rattus norvegicus TaxID=10116 RepID=Q63389_RAT|nr:ORF; putative [Rattus norvegicus]
MGPASRFPVL